LLKRTNETHYPRAQQIKQHLDEGQVLSNSDLSFLQRVVEGGNEAVALFQANPTIRNWP